MASTPASKSSIPHPGGRPRLHDEPKHKRQLSLTDTAHQGIQTIAEGFGMKSRSELIEAIGRQDVAISLPESSDINSTEIRIMPRLLATMQPPVCRFHSTLALARLLAYKFNIIETVEDYFENEKMVIEVVRKSLIILALEDYLYPNEYLMDVSSSMQWLVYKMLVAKAKIQDKSPTTKDFKEIFCPPDSDDEEKQRKKLRNNNLNSVINQIFNAYYLLKRTHPLHYQIIYMRVAERFTFTQIYKILRLLDNDITEESAILYMRKGMNAMRQNWYELNKEKVTERYTDAKGYEGADRLFNSIEGLLAKAQFFYDLIDKDLFKKEGKGNVMDTDTEKEHRFQFECLLLKSMLKPDLALALGEVLHAQECQIVNKLGVNFKKYDVYQQSATEEIAATFEENLRSSLNQLKSKIKMCGMTRKCFKTALMTLVSDIAEIEIPEEYFYKKRKFLEDYLPLACRLDSDMTDQYPQINIQ
jgi:hypothetical protein